MMRNDSPSVLAPVARISRAAWQARRSWIRRVLAG
jgi:hypothetical protein